MPETLITPELVSQHGLTPEEYSRVLKMLGREPTFPELGVFSVMWSEHCSYKNTRPLLKSFAVESDKILVGAGEENAGIIDIGDGLAVAFKIESHNHPSAVEPFQGAATGVGGILRDIFTMGARPVCAMNSLRFGNPDSPDVQRLFRGVVEGIAHYGNCFGIPTVGGEVCFDPCYDGNPLVNAFALGVLRHEQIARGAAVGIGNPVFYVGPPTGRDGLAGAAFASQDLTEESADKQRSAVQVGDPFMEKLLVEACLELLDTDCVAGIQDMGAAGLTCSSCETASRGGTGIEIDLEKVPQRGPGMTPYEILLSESQERMLIIVHQGREEEVKRIFDKWDLPWACVGQVTDTGNMVVRHHGEIVVDVSARLLTDEGPVYHREDRQPSYMESTQAFRLDGISDTNDPTDHLKSLLAWPTIASKNWVYRQYDHMVRNGTVVCPGSDAAVIRIKADSIPAMKGLAGDSASFPEKLLAMSVDCNAVYVYLDPYEGGKAAVAEAARNLACSGATPLGVTDNLNFGNPHKPEIFYQLKEAVRGVAEACRVFKAPVTGGNVSLYNQNPDGAIDPTPTIAMVGQIENSDWVTTQWFKNTGDAIYLLGNPVDENDPLSGLGGSAYLQCLHGLKTGTPPPCDLEREKKLNEALLHLIGKGWIQSAHDCSDGGLAVALAESCFSRETTIDQPELHGANIDLSTAGEERLDALLFGESQARIIISCNPSDEASIVECMEQKSVPYCRLGSVGGDSLIIQTETLKVNCSIADLHDIWWNSIALKMSGD